MLNAERPDILEDRAAQLEARAARLECGGISTPESHRLRQEAWTLREKARGLRHTRTDGVRFG